MAIDIIYNKMLEKLKASDISHVVAELEDADAGAATGSEALMLTGYYLSNLRHKNPSAYELIKEQIKEYLDYCEQNGLIIKER